MKKINSKILSIPPYISTAWKNINTLHVKEMDGNQSLVVVLHTGTEIEIPNVSLPLVEEVFAAHSAFLESETESHSPESLKQYEPSKSPEAIFSMGMPFKLEGGIAGMDQFGSILQHNQEQANAPDLPPEILQKIAQITSSLGMNLNQMDIPKAEPHCNCVYCQFARTIQENSDSIDDQHSEEDEIVTDSDLTFKDWDIKQDGDKLFIVTNPLDADEHYQVFLGDPLGCTCGNKNCEHIRTVLNT